MEQNFSLAGGNKMQAVQNVSFFGLLVTENTS